MTRLASLHRAASSRVASTRDGSLEVSSHVGLGPDPSLPERSPYTNRRPCLTRAVAASNPPVRKIDSPGGLRGNPFKALPPDRMGTGRPAPALLWLARQRSNAARASASGLRSPVGVLEDLEGPLVAFLGFLSGVFSSTARADRFVLPEPSSYVLPAPSPVGGRHPAPWSLANGGVGWSLRDCLPL
jgi:hypothetical protein